MKKLSIAALLSTSMLVTSCGLNMKPEHPQAYDSFEKRRAPRDNQIAATGGLGDKSPYPSNFSEFSGSVVGKSSEAGRTVPDSKTTGYSQESMIDSVKSKINEPKHQDNVPTAPNTSILDRLKEKFSFHTITESNQFSSARVRPVENNTNIHLASVGATTYTQNGQGSDVIGYNYYDLADEINLDSEVYQIKDHTLIQLAKNEQSFNPSAPLVDVDDAPSYDEIKREANLDAKPQIKDIPPVPKRVKEHKFKNQIGSQSAEHNAAQEKIEVRTIQNEARPSATKPSNKVAAQETKENIESDYRLEDRTASIVYIEGKHVVTGTLGKLRK